MSKTPVRLPDGPMPEEEQQFLEDMQNIIFGKTSIEAVQARVCLECGATGITDRDFASPENMRWYFVFGACQACQDKLAQTVKIVRLVEMLRSMGL